MMDRVSKMLPDQTPDIYHASILMDPGHECSRSIEVEMVLRDINDDPEKKLLRMYDDCLIQGNQVTIEENGRRLAHYSRDPEWVLEQLESLLYGSVGTRYSLEHGVLRFSFESYDNRYTLSLENMDNVTLDVLSKVRTVFNFLNYHEPEHCKNLSEEDRLFDALRSYRQVFLSGTCSSYRKYMPFIFCSTPKYDYKKMNFKLQGNFPNGVYSIDMTMLQSLDLLHYYLNAKR